MKHNDAIAALTNSIYIQPEDILAHGFITSINTATNDLTVVYGEQSSQQPEKPINTQLVIDVEYFDMNLTSAIMMRQVKIVIVKDEGDLHV